MDGQDAAGVQLFARRHPPAILDAAPAEAVARRLPPLGGRAAYGEGDHQDYEYRGRDCGVKPIALDDEDHDRQCHACHGSGDQHQQSSHHDGLTISVTDSIDYFADSAQHPRFRPRRKVSRMVYERDHHAQSDDAHTQQNAGAQQRGNGGVDPGFQPMTPLSSICAAMSTSTTTNVMRIDRLPIRASVCDPTKAPPRTPMATGAAMNGSICPREKYTPALAAAVTPIMKLLVAVDTLMGSSIARSIAGTFNEPEPMPRSPLTVPAIYISARPMRARTG